MKIILIDKKGFTKETEGAATSSFTWMDTFGEVEFKLHDIKDNVATYHEAVENSRQD